MLSRKTTQLFTFAYIYPYIHTIYSLGSATRQLDELQTSHKEELGHLNAQLERTTSRIGVLERELAVAREAKESLDKVVLGLKQEMEKM